MHICVLIRKLWREAGLYTSRKAGVQAFLTYVTEHPNLTWEEGVQEFRAHHYDVFNDVVPPLLASTDKLLRLALIRSSDSTRRKELNLLRKFIQETNPVQDEPELLAILELGHQRLADEIRHRTNLTSAVRSRVQQ
jgi:hypothetical protein